MTLEILSTTGTPLERKRAKKICKLIRHHHWLLVTLLLANAMAMEALPIFLDQLVPSALAIMVSVSAILFFGEVIPQALCSRYGLLIGWASYYLVFTLMIISAPISWPVSKLLDCVLGANHATFFRRAQLKELVTLHGEERLDELTDGHSKKKKAGIRPSEGPLTADEISVIRGALGLSEKTLSDIMTTLDNSYMLPFESCLDLETMQRVLQAGHSRIPIYRNGDRQDLCGILLVKRIIALNPADATPVSSLRLRSMPAVRDDYTIWGILNKFQEGKSHMAAVFRLRETEMIEEVVELQDSDSDQEEDELGVDLNPKRNKPKRMSNLSLETLRGRQSMDVRDLSGHRGEIIGIVTLEDVLEELIQEEIVDETDVYVDLNTHLKVAEAYRRMSMAARRSDLQGDRGSFFKIRGVKGAGPESGSSSVDVVIRVPGDETPSEIPDDLVIPGVPVSKRKKKKKRRRVKKRKKAATAVVEGAGDETLPPVEESVEMTDMTSTLISEE